MNFAVREILSRCFVLVSWRRSKVSYFRKRKKRRNKETFWAERSSEKGTKGDDPTRFRGETVPLGEKKGKEIYTRGENQRRAKSRKTETKTWIPFKRENNSGTGESRHPP